MEYDFKEMVTKVVKIVALVVILISFFAVLIYVTILYEKEKKNTKALESDIETLVQQLYDYDNKLIEQSEQIEELKVELGLRTDNSEFKGGKDKIIKGLDRLKEGNEEAIRYWFGHGVEYNADKIIEVTKYMDYKFIDSDSTDTLRLHICNIDNKRLLKKIEVLDRYYIEKNVAMKDEDRKRLVKTETDSLIDSGEYEKHYNVSINILDGEIEINDELKQAITGGWYMGTSDELKNYRCIYNQ